MIISYFLAAGFAVALTKLIIILISGLIPVITVMEALSIMVLLILTAVHFPLNTLE